MNASPSPVAAPASEGSAERAKDRDAGRAASDGDEERELGVRLVLLDRHALEGDARRGDPPRLVRSERVDVADDDVGPKAERDRREGAAVGRDDEVARAVPARPRGVEGGTLRGIPPGDDDDPHGRAEPPSLGRRSSGLPSPA